MALPGPASSTLSWGCLELVKLGIARLATSAAGGAETRTGTLYPAADQVFRRKVSVSKVNLTVSDLGTQFTGLTVKVTVIAPTGQQWVFQRFIPEPPQ